MNLGRRSFTVKLSAIITNVQSSFPSFSPDFLKLSDAELMAILHSFIPVYSCVQVLVGNERQDCPLPVTFSEAEFSQLTEAAKQLSLEVNLVHQCYQKTGSEYSLVEER